MSELNQYSAGMFLLTGHQLSGILIIGTYLNLDINSEDISSTFLPAFFRASIPAFL